MLSVVILSVVRLRSWRRPKVRLTSFSVPLFDVLSEFRQRQVEFRPQQRREDGAVTRRRRQRRNARRRRR
jgi:hypothetical protein